MELGNRKKRILKAIVDEYIKTGEPVGSKSIAGTEGLEISPATLRNEMSELEAIGYLDKPHISAGRVPSDLGYREYVDNLMGKYMLTDGEQSLLQLHSLEPLTDRGVMLNLAARRLSEALGYTAVVVSFKDTVIIIRRLELIPIDNRQLAAVVIIGGGAIRSFTCRIETNTDVEKLGLFCAMLNKRLAGHGIKSPEDIDALLEDTAFFSEYMAVVEAIKHALYAENSYDVYTGGVSRLFDYPEYCDIDRARNFLFMMDQKDRLVNALMSLNDSRPVNVFIGGENSLDSTRCTSVAAGFQTSGPLRSIISVIGPKRMDYARVVAALEYIMRLLGGGDV